MTTTEQTIFSLGIVPVVTIHRAQDAAPLARALRDGGLPMAEVTFRTDAAANAIRAIRKDCPEVLAGAGTITSVKLAQEALDAGAAFIVTPGFNPEVVRWCLDKQIPVYPGCTTASEVEAAMNLGLSVVKFFPAEQSGGLAKIKALAAPYQSMRFMPTGGVNLNNMGEYLRCPAVFACGGSFMVTEDLIANGKWDEMKRLCRKALQEAQGFGIAHAGLYVEDDANAHELAQVFSRMTAQPVLNDCEASVYIGDGLELMKSSAPCKSHIGYAVHNVERSCCFLESLGYRFREETVRRNERGARIFGYLEGEYGGAWIHLCQRK